MDDFKPEKVGAELWGNIIIGINILKCDVKLQSAETRTEQNWSGPTSNE